jgi:hypothetical protein
MKALKTAIGFLAALALALPASSAAAGETAAVVPPENSAATQYTEAVPTAGGDSTSGGHKKPSPAKVLGSKNAHKLESQGKDGREVARVVAETAPAPSASTATGPPVEARPESHDSQQRNGKVEAGDGKPGGRADRPRQAEPPTAKPPTTTTELPSGSSGLGEIVAEATGSSSSGQLGALLPLAILAAIAWSLAFFWRQRRPAD